MSTFSAQTNAVKGAAARTTSCAQFMVHLLRASRINLLLSYRFIKCLRASRALTHVRMRLNSRRIIPLSTWTALIGLSLRDPCHAHGLLPVIMCHGTVRFNGRLFRRREGCGGTSLALNRNLSRGGARWLPRGDIERFVGSFY